MNGLANSFPKLGVDRDTPVCSNYVILRFSVRHWVYLSHNNVMLLLFLFELHSVLSLSLI